jgi:hypothetical protein
MGKVARFRESGGEVNEAKNYLRVRFGRRGLVRQSLPRRVK